MVIKIMETDKEKYLYLLSYIRMFSYLFSGLQFSCISKFVTDAFISRTCEQIFRFKCF